MKSEPRARSGLDTVAREGGCEEEEEEEEMGQANRRASNDPANTERGRVTEGEREREWPRNEY